ncbi:MAG: hypothetical protein V3V51_08850 [Desulfobacterales bacterium]
MNFTSKKFVKRVYRCLFIGFALLMLPANSFAGTDILKNFSFDDCDPFEARALIMEVHSKKAQLVAAEQTIYVVDMSLGDQRLITEIADAEGNQTDFGSFTRGQWVYVKGFKHINGGVVASLIQKIDPPVNKKPVLRKMTKKTRRYESIKRRAVVIKQ